MKIHATFLLPGYDGTLEEYSYTFDYDNTQERAVFAQRSAEMLAEGWEVSTRNLAYYRPSYLGR